MNINILYEDEEVIVCEKPAGVAAQTRRLGQADMESLLKNYRAGKGDRKSTRLNSSHSRKSRMPSSA